MIVETFDTNEHGQPGGWTLSGWSSLEELFEFRENERMKHPGWQLLFVLDDQGQADYTSMHAVNSLGLDVPDMTTMSTNERELYENELILSPQRWSYAVQENLRKNIEVEQADFSLFRQELLPVDSEEIELVEAYKNPMVEVFCEPLRCHRIETNDPSMAVAAHPNGYFAGDLSPGQNYILAEHLRKTYSYEIVGLGSFFAAYVRAEPLTTSQAAELINSIAIMYMPTDPTVTARWVEAATDQRWLLLHYRGS